jgi:hypothetical protein
MGIKPDQSNYTEVISLVAETINQVCNAALQTDPGKIYFSILIWAEMVS